MLLTFEADKHERELLGKDLDMASKSIKEIVKCGHNLKLLSFRFQTGTSKDSEVVYHYMSDGNSNV